MMKKKTKILSMLIILSLLPFPCLSETVVTSFYPIWLIALNLTSGIPDLEVTNLAAPETGCLHDYQLQTGDMKKLAEADLFLVNGAGMESYLDMVFDAFPALPVADASEGIPLLYDVNALEIGESEEKAEANAHIWLSASNVSQMAQNLSMALLEKFPQFREKILENLEGYQNRMAKLDEDLKASLSDLPHRSIITFHEAFPYFAYAYGLDVVAVVNREPGDTLTPAQLAALADIIVDLGKPPLFVEPQYEDLSARTLAAETGTRIYTLDPIVTGPEADVPLDYYEIIMKQNMETLREALGK